MTRTTGKHRGTPDEVFDYAESIWGPYDLDVCAEPWNARAARYYTKEQNALDPKWGWHGRVWCNPPWSSVEAFLDAGRRAIALAEAELITYCLPARAGRPWWDAVQANGYVRLGRITYLVGPGEEQRPGGFEDSVLTTFVRPFPSTAKRR